MNKCRVLIICSGIGVLFFLFACKDGNKKDKLAVYVSKNENGLTKKITDGETEIITQFIPEKIEKPDTGNKNRVYKFMVYVNTKAESMTDSILYIFNYHSSDYFRLVSGNDTLKPVLSERIANGRREANQFTVLFDMEGKNKLADPLSLLFLGNKLFRDSLVFHYELKDLKKASKTLYGYE